MRHWLPPRNGDGDEDLIYAIWEPSRGILGWIPNNGTELFGGLILGDPVPITAALDLPLQIRATDFDGDSDVDLLVADPGSQRVALFLNHGDALFADPISISEALVFPESFDFGDLDGDWDLDIVVADSRDNGEITLHRAAVRLESGCPRQPRQPGGAGPSLG